MDSLLDDIYEAALAPRHWSNVLAALAVRFKARGGLLFTSNGAESRWLGSGDAAEAMPEFIDQGWMARNERVQRLTARRHTGFLTDLDLFSSKEVEALPIYTQFLSPRGMSAGAGCVVSGLEDDTLILSLEGFADHGAARTALGELDEIRPHLARAAMISARLQAERAMTAVTVLDAIGSPAAVVDHRGVLLTANTLFEPEIPARFRNTRAGLRLLDELADHRLQRTLESVRRGLGGDSVPAPGPNGRARLLHVLPVVREANDVFLAASAILVLTGHANRLPPGRALLEQLFDLSPAEARVAEALADGATLRQIAKRANTSIHTVRNQLKAVLEKSSTASQVELIRILMDLAKPARPSVQFGI
jgi:DNA-binding CsgD family transcriptional regulator